MKLRIGILFQAMMDGMMKATMVAIGLTIILAVGDCDGYTIGAGWDTNKIEYGTNCVIVQGAGNVITNADRVVILNANNLKIDGHTNDDTLVQRNLLLTGSLRTTSIRFVGYDASRDVVSNDVDHRLCMDDHILILGKRAVLHLTGAGNTPDGMRIIVRSDVYAIGEDVDITMFDGVGIAIIHPLQYVSYPNPRITCKDAECDIRPLNGSYGIERTLYNGVSEEYVFYARHNAWYQI